MGKPTMWFLTSCDTNRPVQAQKRARSLKFWIKVEEELYYPSTKTKALISFPVTAKLICVFVFAYADCWFSHGAAQFWYASFKLIFVYSMVSIHRICVFSGVFIHRSNPLEF